jgi:hypothetical protein
MDWMTISDRFTLTDSWHLIDLEDFDLIKITALDKPTYTNTISTSGRFELAQFDSDNSCINLRAVRHETFSLIFELPKPSFFEKNNLGLKLAPDFAPFSLEIKGLKSDMSLTTSKVSPASKATTRTFDPMVTDITPVKGAAVNDKRRGIIVTNSHTSNLILGYSNAVTSLPGKNFAVIPPGETYESNVSYTGEIWYTTELTKTTNQSYIELEGV